ncbi:MAG: 3-isopropylmalate dehydratase small subunit [Symbiobacteriaceae bacterium]|jgi:3-isopropylmalate/(R)-2-methylmalate dehydratase small subunit|nr:3-isopropylmalate dehydratase small subunit [Symbiobacteriaceae bacterium]
MERFLVHSGTVVPLDRANVDTDQLTPKEFLKGTERTGYGKVLMYNWRYLSDGQPNPDFVLNQPQYRAGAILVAGRNFGCGSSREHAVWALQDYGFRVIIAPTFADIFYNNCFKSGLLPISLPEATVDWLLQQAKTTETFLTVDLQHCVVTDGQTFHEPFQVDPDRREALMQGLDEIGMTLRYVQAIEAFEARRAMM